MARKKPAKGISHNPRISRRTASYRWGMDFALLNLKYEEKAKSLKCPNCGRPGPWRAYTEPIRMLCKWCGYYEDPTRTGFCRPCLVKKVWMLKPLKPGKTPKELCSEYEYDGLDPWRY